MVHETFSGRHSQEDDDADENVLAEGQAAQDGHRHFQGEPVGAWAQQMSLAIVDDSNLVQIIYTNQFRWVSGDLLRYV